MIKMKVTGATIPYQLRPHKAIERNLFVTLLKKIDRCSIINIGSYRYVGFGAAFLEDFKILHSEFGIIKMDCIEYDFYAHTRQDFNNPYQFIKLYNTSSTKYITEGDLKTDINQIIWLDYASPKEFRQQLLDIELLSEKVSDLDILKFTFNSNLSSFCASLKVNKDNPNYNKLLSIMKDDSTYMSYLPDKIIAHDLVQNFSGVLRAMAIRAIQRGIAKGHKKLEYHHLCSFSYSDGQYMTTMTGIITKSDQSELIIDQSGISQWEFYQKQDNDTEYIIANEISVPSMTVAERIVIDKNIDAVDVSMLAKSLNFMYGTSELEHLELIKGYYKYYKYLPYYSKVIY